MMKLFSRACAAMMLLFAVSACALTEDVVDLNYAPTQEQIDIGANGKQIGLSVQDIRGEYKGRIGAKTNGFGAELADIKSSVPVRDVLYNAMVDELKARGIAVQDGLPSEINIDITALHNNYQVGMFSSTARGITAFTVKVTDEAGKTLYDGAVSEVYEEGGVMIMGGANAAKSVTGALTKAMKTLFEDEKFVQALIQS